MDLYHICCNLKPGVSDVAFAESIGRYLGAVEELHAAVNQAACDLTFALYRDFPDPHRKRGSEKF